MIKTLWERLTTTQEERSRREVAILIKGTFGTELGLRCLEHLVTVFADRDIYKIGMTPEEVAFRQGEASVVKKIVAEVINKTPQEQEEEDEDYGR